SEPSHSNSDDFRRAMLVNQPDSNSELDQHVPHKPVVNRNKHPETVIENNQEGEELDEMFSVPYDVLRTPLILSYLSQTVHLPEDIRQRLVWPPDHVEEARRECVYQFIEELFLPYIESGVALSAIQLAKLAERFKVNFEQQHPEDPIGNYE